LGLLIVPFVVVVAVAAIGAFGAWFFMARHAIGRLLAPAGDRKEWHRRLERTGRNYFILCWLVAFVAMLIAMLVANSLGYCETSDGIQSGVPLVRCSAPAES
jgi:membrane-bound metal-dependent hydrolase YbcI (DUF457 family)